MDNQYQMYALEASTSRPNNTDEMQEKYNAALWAIEMYERYIKHQCPPEEVEAKVDIFRKIVFREILGQLNDDDEVER